MKLHKFIEFNELISVVAERMHLPETAVARDYFIVMALDNLSRSDYYNKCVFKGGTSLSKCYKNSIERFSEDIDLTFLGMDLSDKECDKNLKQIEKIMATGFNFEKFADERSNRSKSSYIWINNKSDGVKLEIGSSVRPEPYAKKVIKSYIQEYLEEMGFLEDVKKFELNEVDILTLGIERTFIDKIMSIKRHAYANTLSSKFRHIYDVVKLFNMYEIQEFLKNEEELKRIVVLTKETDSYYLKQKNVKLEYNPMEKYNYDTWREKISSNVVNEYEMLHKKLLFTDQKQEFREAEETLLKISNILKEIEE